MPLRYSCLMAQEDNFKGIVDLIEKKLVVYKDELGKEFEIRDIPADLSAEVEKYRNILLENCRSG